MCAVRFKVQQDFLDLCVVAEKNDFNKVLLLFNSLELIYARKELCKEKMCL